MSRPADHPDNALWVRTDPHPLTGEYSVTITAGQDRAWPMPGGCTLYAERCMRAVALVEHDAAVIRGATRMNLERAALGQLIGDIRAGRVDSATGRPHRVRLLDGLEAEPIATADGRAEVGLYLEGAAWGQVTADQLREHAAHAMCADVRADQDERTYAALIKYGLPSETVRAFIGSLAEES